MPDGARLPARVWLPDRPPWAVVLALHGMNDSRDAWEIPAPAFADAGIAIVAPDQRGFGDSAARGYWPGVPALADDATTMARLLRARYPGARLFIMGESMGAAVAMVAATAPRPPPADGYVLLAPAVWGRRELDLSLRATLWLAYQFVPGITVGHAPGVKVIATDNREALRRLWFDPLTIHDTRIDAIKGLVDLEDAALAAAPRVPAPSLFLYGGKDDLVPKHAMTDVWRALPEGNAAPRLAFYPGGHHMLLRDRDRAPRLADIIAWMRDPAPPLPSGADAAARTWLARGEAPESTPVASETVAARNP